MRTWIAHFLLLFLVPASAQTTRPSDGKLDFGEEGLTFPPVRKVNGSSPRTVQLLGDAYRGKDPLVWKRAQYIADLGRAARVECAPFLIDAMHDPAPQVRAEAARSARNIEDASDALTPELEKLLSDPDPSVRRESVASQTHLCQSSGGSTSAIDRALSDADWNVVAIAIQSAWTELQARSIADKLPSFPKELRTDAALTLARLKVSDLAPAVVPLLDGDVAQRVAALQALAAMHNPSQSPAVLKMLDDPHPTVRREAVTALIILLDDATRVDRAIRMLKDADPTVRQAVAGILTPVPSDAAMHALIDQLGESYPPLHEALRRALTQPREQIQETTVSAFSVMLGDPNPRRREDASYVLGRLRSNANIERHIALLHDKDLAVVAQAAESLGMIGDARAAAALMSLVKPSPENLAGLGRSLRDLITQGSASALVSLGRLRYPQALPEAVRIIQLDPAQSPTPLRAAAAFVVGVLGKTGTIPSDVNLLGIYASINEGAQTKFEALKALGNLKHSGSADRLLAISQSDPTPAMRWIAHWSYQRASAQTVPYVPPTEGTDPPVTILDLAKPGS